MASEDPRLRLEVQPHHEQRRICASRAKYREGREPRAVKVYTINLESRYLLVQGVPAIGVMKELVEQFALYGAIEEYNVLDEYPAEEFTEVFLIKFQRLQSARVAKRKLDERSFFGGILHVCYAPEFENVQETREKLQERRRFVARATSHKVKDHQVVNKRKEVSESSTLMPSQFPVNCEHASYDQPEYTGDPLASLCGPTPSVAPEYIHEDYPLSHPSAWDSGHKSIAAAAHHTERTIGPTQGRPKVASSAMFMPRTTQLQERQRRREERTKLNVLPDPDEVVIGPKLPEIPKLDMADNSLNISADFIRGKLKEVSALCTLSGAVPPAADTATAPPVKQRRRI